MMRDQLKSLKTACGIMKNQIHDFFKICNSQWNWTRNKTSL